MKTVFNSGINSLKRKLKKINFTLNIYQKYALP